MKKLIGRIKEYVAKHRDEQWFKYTVTIVVLLIAAVCVNQWRKWEDSKELPQTEIVEEAPEEEKDYLQAVWDESKAHFIVFGILSISLFVIKCRNDVKLEESKRMKK